MQMLRLQFKNHHNMIRTVHTGNVYALENPSSFIGTDAFMNNGIILYVDQVLYRERL